MNQVKNILAAADQFPQDAPVLARAVEIARAHGARLTIVHVLDVVTGFDGASADFGLVQEQVRRLARENIEAAIAGQVFDIVGVDIRVETGSPSLRLIELSEELHADLIVMRAHQRSSIVEKIIGSTTDRVIRASRPPVLVIKRPVTQAYQRVVVATDPADDPGEVVPFVAALFPLIGLQLVHVVHIPPQFEAAMLGAGYGQGVATHCDALVRKAKACLRDLSKSLAHRPTRSVARVVVGDPATSLVRATWSPKVDLIVLGPGSTGRIRRALLGSVTRRVLGGAACDVLICRPVPEDAGEQSG